MDLTFLNDISNINADISFSTKRNYKTVFPGSDFSHIMVFDIFLSKF